MTFVPAAVERPEFQALKRLRQEDYEFRVSLGYLQSSCL